jgi:SAM-dependent methyltransferase
MGYPLVQRCAIRFELLKRGLRVLHDWKIYGEFLSPDCQQHNIARLQHLESLGLSLERKSVLEVGAGFGDHTLFYLHRNCRVLPVEGRPRQAKRISERLGIDAKVLDLDNEPEKLKDFGHFDIVHCYGLLYHLSDPGRLLTSLSQVSDCLLLETCVSRDDALRTNATPEDKYVPSQALHGEGCRPSRQWVFRTLKQLYPHVYATRTTPHHPDFPVDWSVRNGSSRRLTRAIFVASHYPIDNTNLLTELPCRHDPW